MALVLTEEQNLLRDSVSALLAEKSPVSALRSLRDQADATGFSRELWRCFAEMGFAGVLVPEAQGGAGLGLTEAGVIAEALGRTLCASPFFSTSVLGVTVLRLAGAAGCGAMLEKIVTGDMLLALAAEESARHSPYKIATTAKAAAHGYVLNGEKLFVVDGHCADTLIVVARTSGAADSADGLTLFLVDAKSSGITIERTIMVDAHNAARIRFKDVAVMASAILGPRDGGRSILDAAFDAGRAVLAAELTGAGEEVFARTVAYLKERKQFGRIIGSYQALQHRAAHLFCELEVSRSAVAKALLAQDEGDAQASALASLAKARACRSTNLAVQEAVQMHGGIGMTDAVDIGLFMKRARVLQELFGDERFHADRLARLSGY